MSGLEDYKKAVHAAGFNISRMINKFKKDQRERKALYEVPESVYIEICKEYLLLREVRDSYPYFMKVLNLKSHEHFANKNISENNKNQFSKTMPSHLRDLLNPPR